MLEVNTFFDYMARIDSYISNMKQYRGFYVYAKSNSDVFIRPWIKYDSKSYIH